MNQQDYARLLASPRVKTRSVLEQTARLIEPYDRALATRLYALLAGPAIPKPPNHPGGADSDRFDTSITKEDAAQITEILFGLEADAVPTDGSHSREADRIATLVDEWNRLSFGD